MTQGIVVEGWDVRADKKIGIDQNGATYYQLGNEVFKNQSGSTRWYCTLASWHTVARAYDIKTNVELDLFT